jgi:hypothetical protein
MDLARQEARVMRAIARGHASVMALSEECGFAPALIARICWRLQGRNFAVRTDGENSKRGHASYALTLRGDMVIRGMDTPAPPRRRRARLASAELSPRFSPELLQVPQPIIAAGAPAPQPIAGDLQVANG